MNMGAVALLDAATLLTAGGAMPLVALRERLAARLPLAPRLRQIIHRAGPLSGGPIWIEDPGFRIENHIDHLVAPAPGDEQALLLLAARLMVPVLDRRRPLWRMWFVTGLAGGRVAVILKLHHVMADGLRAINVLTMFFGDTDPVPAPAAAASPRWQDLAWDNMRAKASSAARLHPARVMAALAGAREAARRARGAPRTTFNHPVGAHHALAVLSLDLATVKQVAHRHGGKVNDVVLDLAAAGLRDVMRARGELTGPVSLHAAVAVSMRSRNDTAAPPGNHTGEYVAHLPVSVSDPSTRLRLISADTAVAKHRQSAAAGNTFLVLLARLGVLGWVSRHQRLTNLVESNMPGPPAPITLLGAPVRELIPIGTLAGNLSIAFVALSYDGRLNVTIQADTTQFGNLTSIVLAAQQEWKILRSAAPTEIGGGN